MISEENVLARISYYAEQLKQNGANSEKGKQAIIVMKELLFLLDETTQSSPSNTKVNMLQTMQPNYSQNMDRFMMGAMKEEDEDGSSGGSLLDF